MQEGLHRDRKELKYQIADAVQCARELCYKAEYIERIKKAKNEFEIISILAEARRSRNWSLNYLASKQQRNLSMYKRIYHFQLVNVLDVKLPIL